jgi:hypothetical protein
MPNADTLDFWFYQVYMNRQVSADYQILTTVTPFFVTIIESHHPQITTEYSECMHIYEIWVLELGLIMAGDFLQSIF